MSKTNKNKFSDGKKWDLDDYIMVPKALMSHISQNESKRPKSRPDKKRRKNRNSNHSDAPEYPPNYNCFGPPSVNSYYPCVPNNFNMNPYTITPFPTQYVYPMVQPTQPYTMSTPNIANQPGYTNQPVLNNPYPSMRGEDTYQQPSYNQPYANDMVSTDQFNDTQLSGNSERIHPEDVNYSSTSNQGNNVDMHIHKNKYPKELSELEYNRKLQDEYELDYLRRIRELELLQEADRELLRELRGEKNLDGSFKPSRNPKNTPTIKEKGFVSALTHKSSSEKDKVTSEKDPISLYLPLKSKNKDTPLQKPESSEGIFRLLFPQAPSTSDKKNTSDEPTKRKDRSKFVKGKPMEVDIETLDDLLALSDKIGTEYKITDNYALDLESLQKMTPCLRKLKSMIGLTDIKDKIVHQVLFFLQGLDETNRDMLHTVIEGDPGVGKTEIAKILGEIYGSLGILSKGTFTSVKRADLVGSYLGQTASKTLKVLEEAKGGVLFIDEAYSLGNEEGKDIYSKECIDTITAFLSENREDFVCVIAGYKQALRQCFFKYNAGLERRFPWTYSIKSYSPEELKLILEKMVQESSWTIKAELKFFTDNKDKFKHYGGDMENLFHKAKLSHSMRAIKLQPEEKKIITMDDLEGGMKLFLEEEEEKKEVSSFSSMYM